MPHKQSQCVRLHFLVCFDYLDYLYSGVKLGFLRRRKWRASGGPFHLMSTPKHHFSTHVAFLIVSTHALFPCLYFVISLTVCLGLISVLTSRHSSVLILVIFRFPLHFDLLILQILCFIILYVIIFEQSKNTAKLSLFAYIFTLQTPKCWTGRFLMNLWAIFCLLVLSSYTANLAAVMVGEKTFEQVSGIHDDKVRLHTRTQTCNGTHVSAPHIHTHSEKHSYMCTQTNLTQGQANE